MWGSQVGSSPQHPSPGPGEEASSPPRALGSILPTSSGEAPDLENKGILLPAHQSPGPRSEDGLLPTSWGSGIRQSLMLIITPCQGGGRGSVSHTGDLGDRGGPVSSASEAARAAARSGLLPRTLPLTRTQAQTTQGTPRDQQEAPSGVFDNQVLAQSLQQNRHLLRLDCGGPRRGRQGVPEEAHNFLSTCQASLHKTQELYPSQRHQQQQHGSQLGLPENRMCSAPWPGAQTMLPRSAPASRLARGSGAMPPGWELRNDPGALRAALQAEAAQAPNDIPGFGLNQPLLSSTQPGAQLPALAPTICPGRGAWL